MCIRWYNVYFSSSLSTGLHLTLGIFIVHNYNIFFSMVVCVDEFFAFYCSTFPESTVMPKLHILVDHVVPFISKWRVGLGMMCEQYMYMYMQGLTP